jgi:hypothetical protein
MQGANKCGFMAENAGKMAEKVRNMAENGGFSGIFPACLLF